MRLDRGNERTLHKNGIQNQKVLVIEKKKYFILTCLFIMDWLLAHFRPEYLSFYLQQILFAMVCTLFDFVIEKISILKLSNNAKT